MGVLKNRKGETLLVVLRKKGTAVTNRSAKRANSGTKIRVGICRQKRSNYKRAQNTRQPDPRIAKCFLNAVKVRGWPKDNHTNTIQTIAWRSIGNAGKQILRRNSTV